MARFPDEKYRAPLGWLLFPHLAGLLTARVMSDGSASDGWLAAALGCALVSLVLMHREPPQRIGGWAATIVTAAFCAGFWHMDHALRELPRWRDLPPREATLVVEITRVYAPNPAIARQSCLGRVVSAPPPIDDLIEQRLFFSLPTGADAAPPIRSQRLRIHGVLTPLRATDVAAGSFDAYLASLAIPFRLDRVRLVDKVAPPTGWHLAMHRLGRRFETILRRGLPAEHVGTNAYIAMFLGRRSELSETQKENFLRSGTMHLFAISGLHIAMIAFCLHSLLNLVRVPRLPAAVVGLLALLMFVEATGGTPSARRAFLMVGFIWMGTALRRPANPLASLVTAACVVLAFSPLALLSTSFQLSYAVVGTIVLYGTALRNRGLVWWRPFRDKPQPDWRWWHWRIFFTGRWVMTMAAVSVSATLISTPLSLAHFGTASPGAVFTNLVAVPLASGAIAAGFVSLLSGLVVLPFSTVFNHAAILILTVVDACVGWAAALPGIAFEGRFEASWMAPVLVVALLAVVATGYGVGWGRVAHSLWVPPALLITGTVLLVTPGSGAQESRAMKSAYELAMERLRQSDESPEVTLTAEQKQQLAEIERMYQGKIAEREIFLKQRLAEAQVAQQFDECDKIQQQLKSERVRLEEEREAEKNRVRKSAGSA